MIAGVVYYVDHRSFGDDDERTGWYLMRATIADDRGRGLAHGSVIDRVPVAMFTRGVEGAAEARALQDAAAAGVLRVMPRDWTIITAAAALAGFGGAT